MQEEFLTFFNTGVKSRKSRVGQGASLADQTRYVYLSHADVAGGRSIANEAGAAKPQKIDAAILREERLAVTECYVPAVCRGLHPSDAVHEVTWCVTGKEGKDRQGGRGLGQRRRRR